MKSKVLADRNLHRRASGSSNIADSLTPSDHRLLNQTFFGFAKEYLLKLADTLLSLPFLRPGGVEKMINVLDVGASEERKRQLRGVAERWSFVKVGVWGRDGGPV